MAKDLVFESEKYMQRQEAKRKWLPILCIAAILLLVVVIALIVRGGRSAVYRGGEDTPYPYSWSVSKNGELNLQIDNAASEGYTWKATNYDTRGLEMARPEEQPEGASSFTFRPITPGRYVSVFTLVNREDADDALYEWRFMMDSALAAEDGSASAGPLSILSGSGFALNGKRRSGEEDVVSYAVREDSDGGLVFEIINQLQDTTVDKPTAVLKDMDEGDEVSGEMRGEEDGGQPPKLPEPSQGTETIISDPEEIAEMVGMPYEEWLALQKAEAEEAAEVNNIYSYFWTASSDNENAASPAGVFYTGEMAIATINAGTEEGTASIRIFNDDLGLEIFAEVENREGILSVVSCGSKTFEPEPFDPESIDPELLEALPAEEQEEAGEESEAPQQP